MAYADVAKLSHLMAGIASQHAKAFIPDCGLAKKASVGTTFCDSRNPIHPPRSDLSICFNFTTFLKIYLITIYYAISLSWKCGVSVTSIV